MAYIDTLIEKFPIRKTKAQKEAFRAWVLEECAHLGYAAQEEKKGSSTNVVVGDADSAQAIFTAHYDTPPGMPWPNFITPCNVPVYILYQVVVVLGLLALSAGAGWVLATITGMDALGFAAAYVIYFGVLLMMMFGPANKNNANDNTSGVASVLETMARIPAGQRDKVAFVLFDNEEKGLLGSNAFATLHKQVKKETLLVNMDCVGLGENILFFAQRKARKNVHYDKLTAAVNAQMGRNAAWYKMEGHMYPSDQNNFKCGIAVCSCKKAPVIGYYCDKIHTRHDTEADAGNIAFIADGLAAFVQSL